LSIIAQICPDIFLRPIVIEQAGVGFHQVVEMTQHDARAQFGGRDLGVAEVG
jgi:hypothetical protein